MLRNIAMSEIEKPKIDARTKFDENAYNELVLSVKRTGLIEPIVVRPKGDNVYEVVCGSRRFLACFEAGMGKIPCIVKNYTDEEVDMIRLDENIVREDMNQVDIARYIERLINTYHITQDEVAARIGRTGGFVSQMLTLLRKDTFVRDLVETGQIQYTTGRELLKIPVEETRKRYARYARDSGASASMVKQWADRELLELNRQAGEFRPPEETAPPEPYVPPIVTHPCIGCGRVGNIEAMVIYRFCPDCSHDLEIIIDKGAFRYEPEQPTQRDFSGEPEQGTDENPSNGYRQATSDPSRSERSPETLQGIEE